MRELNCATCCVASPWPTDAGAILDHHWTCLNGHTNRTMACMVVSMDGKMPYQTIETNAFPDNNRTPDPQKGK